MQSSLINLSSSGREFLRPKLSKHPRLHKFMITMHRIYCSLTGFAHVLPDYYIIGSAKCGTSSLYESLILHPSIHPAVTKEIHFFDRYYDRGISWYKVCFPFKFQKLFKKKFFGKNFITGEATPRYIEHPNTAEKILRITPNAKLIVILRNPIDRAYSHWNMNYRGGEKESLSFEEALEQEKVRINGEYEKMEKNPSYYARPFYRYSYLERSTYVNYLEKWMKVFPKKQLLIIKSEDFFSNPQKVYDRILEFLNLPQFNLEKFKKTRIGKYTQPIDPKTRKELVEYFKPINKKLYDLINENFGWDEN